MENNLRESLFQKRKEILERKREGFQRNRNLKQEVEDKEDKDKEEKNKILVVEKLSDKEMSYRSDYLTEDFKTFKDKIAGYEVTAEYKKALDLIFYKRENVFISGAGGVGKSVFLEILSSILTSQKEVKERIEYENIIKSAMYIAPTGISALRIKGTTIHSAFKFPIHPLDIADLNISSKVQEVVSLVELIVIDEISMVRSDLFSAIDQTLKLANQNELPFGGVQMVIVGDLFQLPPIVGDKEINEFLLDRYLSKYFFETISFREGNFKPVEFTKIFRQEDIDFQDKLNEIRIGENLDESLKYFNNKVMNEIEYSDIAGYNYIYLVGTNRQKDEENQKMLALLDAKEEYFIADIEGRLKSSEIPFEVNLTLKVGCQVMVVWNHLGKHYVNGTIGEVVAIDVENEEVIISVQEEIKGNMRKREVVINKEKVEKFEYVYDKKNKKLDKKTIGKVEQIPLVLAWARTIHKSQSATYDSCYVDFGYKVFSTGMAYTALSRVKSYEKLGLKRPLLKSECKVNQATKKFYLDFFGKGNQ